jgi:lipopolysaccharide export system permease protein
VISSLIVSLLAVINQECVIPYFGEEIARRHDDDGQQKVTYVTSRYDSRGIMIHGKQADRATKTILTLSATTDPRIFGTIFKIDGQQATYIPPDHPTAPLKGGWLVREATINPPLDDETLRASGDILTRVVDLDGFPPPFETTATPEKQDRAAPRPPENPSPTLLVPHSEIAYLASVPPLPLSLYLGIWKAHALLDRRHDFGRGTFFLKSTLTFQAMTRKANWFQFATTNELIESLTDPSTEGSEGIEVAIFVHFRLLRPILSMVLLFLSLPLVLGGYGRNMFINLGLALGNSAIFYGALIFTQYLGTFTLLSPPTTAWVPLIAFGTLASLRWDQIRT